MRRTVTVDSTIRLNAYHIICDAVEQGIAFGWRRAHKHTDEPDEDTVQEEIANAVMNELCDVINFPDADDAA